MNRIKLDPSKLLGFKSMTRQNGAIVLRSAKIGVKVCATRDEGEGQSAPKAITVDR